jgi:MFS family permease
MMMFGIGGALGPAVFGVLVQWLGWSAVFSVRAPIALAAFLLAWTLPRDAGAERREAFDAAGGALLAVTLGCMLLALNQLGHLPGGAGWLGLFALTAVVGGGLFYRQERRCARPIIDVSYFRDADFTAVNLAFALVNLAAFSIMLLVPFYLNQISGLSVPLGGLVLAASPFGTILAAPLAGRLTTMWSPRAVAQVGMFACAAGLAVVSQAGSTPQITLLTWSMFVQGFGMGLLQVAYFDIVTASIPLSNRGVAGALGMATRTIGTVTGATILMLVFQSLQGSAGFVGAFRITFRIAAALPAVLLMLTLTRRR